jgi:isochorismate synthase EntC
MQAQINALLQQMQAQQARIQQVTALLSSEDNEEENFVVLQEAATALQQHTEALAAMVGA